MKRVAFSLISVFLAASSFGQDQKACGYYNSIFSNSGYAVQCKELSEKNIDIKAAGKGLTTCQLESGAQVSLVRTKDDTLNGTIEISSRQGKKTVPLPVPTYLKTSFIQAPSPMACLGNRIAFLHPNSGALSIFDEEGKELWRAPIPGFVSLDSRREKYGDNLPSVMQGLMTELSVGMKLVASGNYIIIEHRTPTSGFWHTIFHISGFLVGQIGPWDSLVLSGNPQGWRFVAGGGPDIRFFTPTVDLTLNTAGFRHQNYVDHFLAWFQPRPIENTFSIGCASRPLDEPKYYVGSAYDLELAQKSRDCFAELAEGGNQLKNLLENPVLKPIIATYEPQSKEWRDKYKNALFDAGMDIELARKCPLPNLVVKPSPRKDFVDPLDLIKEFDFPISSSMKRPKLAQFFASLDGVSGFSFLIQPNLTELVVDIPPGKTSILSLLKAFREKYSLQYEVLKERRQIIVREGRNPSGNEPDKILPKGSGTP